MIFQMIILKNVYKRLSSYKSRLAFDAHLCTNIIKSVLNVRKLYNILLSCKAKFIFEIAINQ
jgi:hypothetical protein